MDSKDRALYSIMIERCWRMIKYECIYINEYMTVKELTDNKGSRRGQTYTFDIFTYFTQLMENGGVRPTHLTYSHISHN